MSLASTRDAIAAAAGTVQGLRAYDNVVGDPKPDCVVVGFPTEFNPHAAFGDNPNYTIPVYLFINFSTNRRADVQMEKYLATSGADSLIAAIEAGSSAWSINNVTGVNVETLGDPGVLVLACTLEVQVLS